MIKVQLDRENYCRLTDPQKIIWYIDKINADLQLHTIGGRLKIKDKINIDILEKAINIVVENNDGLRLRFWGKMDKLFNAYINFIMKRQIL